MTQPAAVVSAFAAVTRSLVSIIAAVSTEIAALERSLRDAFDTHPAAEIYRSQPGLGPVLAVRALAEFGDDPERYADARARKNYAATSPITRQSGKKKTVTARFVHNDRLVDAVIRQAQARWSSRPVRVATTTSYAVVEWGISRRCVSSATVSSASCMAA